MIHTALITGAGGFAGIHLTRLLLTGGWRVTKIISHDAAPANGTDAGETIAVDLRDKASVISVVGRTRPDSIFHLAAKTREFETRTDPQSAFDSTVIGTINLLEAVRSAGLIGTKILIAGSSAEYGRVESDGPIDEQAQLRPVGMYGVTKIAQSMVGLQYHLAYGLPIIRTRAFNHTGPGQSEHFSTAAFAKQIAEIELGIRSPQLMVGDLSGQRDLSDVRDVVRGYAAALATGRPGEVYNIASGCAVSTKEVLDRLIKMSRDKIEVAMDPEKLRPAEAAMQVGNATKILRETGWKPVIPLQQTLADTLNYWREKMRA